MRLRTQTRQRNDWKTPGSIAVYVCIGMALVFVVRNFVSVSSVSKTLNDLNGKHNDDFVTNTHSSSNRQTRSIALGEREREREIFATLHSASISTSPNIKSNMTATITANMNANMNATIKSESKPNVVCTYLRGNKEKYVMGIIVLMESVRASTGKSSGSDDDADIRTAVVCHESVNNETRSLLEGLGHDVIVVEDVPFDNAALPNNRFKPLMQKYVVFDLVQYGKALFVDADAFIYQQKNLPKMFGMLDDDFRKPAASRYSIMKASNIPLGEGGGSWRSHKYSANATVAWRNSNTRKVFMAPDYGPDNFNSGLILYRPEPNMFEDLQRFLNTTVAPLKDQKKRKKLVRSTQRLLQEFLFLPASNYSLYNFCPETLPNKCTRSGCDCPLHIYPHLLDCERQKHLWEQTTVVHFAGSVLNYEQLVDPKSSPLVVNRTIADYFNHTHIQQKMFAPKNMPLDLYELDCQRPMLHNMRNLYSAAVHRARLQRS